MDSVQRSTGSTVCILITDLSVILTRNGSSLISLTERTQLDTVREPLQHLRCQVTRSVQVIQVCLRTDVLRLLTGDVVLQDLLSSRVVCILRIWSSEQQPLGWSDRTISFQFTLQFTCFALWLATHSLSSLGACLLYLILEQLILQWESFSHSLTSYHP